MGKYINQTSKGGVGASASSKCAALLADGATEVNPAGLQANLVCVVDNGHFAAAAYCYNEREFRDFNDPSDKDFDQELTNKIISDGSK